MPRKPFYKVKDARRVPNAARVLGKKGEGLWVKFNRGYMKGFVSDFFIFNKGKGDSNYSYYDNRKSLKYRRKK